MVAITFHDEKHTFHADDRLFSSFMVELKMKESTVREENKTCFLKEKDTLYGH